MNYDKQLIPLEEPPKEPGKMAGFQLYRAPQDPLTAVSGFSANATYSGAEEEMLNNHETRINEIEQALINLGLLKQS